MEISSFLDEYAFQYLLIPTQVLTPRDLFTQAGLPTLPASLNALLDFNHTQLKTQAVIIDSQQRCLHQWNPYSGSFPIESQLSLSQSLDHHRWVLDSFEARMRCLYDGVHEMTHQVLAQLGLMGLTV